MDARRFHNALRVLLNIEINDLRAAGVVDENWGTPEASDRAQLAAFVQDPIREALRMPDDNFDKLFALIESRQPKRDVPDTLTALKALASAPVGSSMVDRARRRNALDVAHAAIAKAEGRS